MRGHTHKTATTVAVITTTTTRIITTVIKVIKRKEIDAELTEPRGIPTEAKYEPLRLATRLSQETLALGQIMRVKNDSPHEWGKKPWQR